MDWGALLRMDNAPASTLVEVLGAADLGGLSTVGPATAYGARADAGVSTYYWFGEHLLQAPDAGGAQRAIGGVGLCSSVDLRHWRVEGVMLHFHNLTMPDGSWRPSAWAARPKVARSLNTTRFVMWANVDNATQGLGLVGVASAAHVNGPYAFNASMYPAEAPLEAPAGLPVNETHDMTVLLGTNGTGLMGATWAGPQGWGRAG